MNTCLSLVHDSLQYLKSECAEYSNYESAARQLKKFAATFTNQSKYEDLKDRQNLFQKYKEEKLALNDQSFPMASEGRNDNITSGALLNS